MDLLSAVEVTDRHNATAEAVTRATDRSINDDTRAVISLRNVDRDQGKGFGRVAGYEEAKTSLKSVSQYTSLQTSNGVAKYDLSGAHRTRQV